MYRQLIADAIANDDTATLALVEEIMRGEHGALDHLDKSRFTRAARQAMATALDYALAGELPMVCEAYELATPTLRV
jgi:hypothetical protein